MGFDVHERRESKTNNGPRRLVVFFLPTQQLLLVDSINRQVEQMAPEDLSPEIIDRATEIMHSGRDLNRPEKWRALHDIIIKGVIPDKKEGDGSLLIIQDRYPDEKLRSTKETWEEFAREHGQDFAKILQEKVEVLIKDADRIRSRQAIRGGPAFPTVWEKS